MNETRSYWCDDGNAAIEIEASGPEAAARKYVDGGDWGEIDSTIWIMVWVWTGHMDDDIGERDAHTVALNPAVPPCSGPEHDWRSPHSVLGGCEQSPGVQGHGGGVILREVCRHCASYRVIDTWAQNPDDGEEGLKSIGYQDPDDDSMAWIREGAAS